MRIICNKIPRKIEGAKAVEKRPKEGVERRREED
jgi:hypothetical protein